MKRFLKHENENLPMSCIPQAFKNRLIQLASLNDAPKLNIAFQYMTVPHRRPHEFYNGVYVTDSRYIMQFASKRARWTWPYCPRTLWRWLQYGLDGPYTINPIWQSVLHVDEIANQDDVLCINDTLVLFLTSEDSYDLIISKIAGSYSRLVLHGYNYTWPQVKRLIHNKVKQVRIMDCIEVYPEEYDDVVEFMLRFSRGVANKFAVRDNCFPSELIAKLNEAFEQHETHSMITFNFDTVCLTHFNHKRYTLLYCIMSVVCIVMMVVFTEGMQFTSTYRSLFIDEPTVEYIICLFFLILLFELLLPIVQFVFLVKSLFKFNSADIDIMNEVNDKD